MQQPVLEMSGIQKSYTGVRVLTDVNLTIGESEILGLVGENGAGKSTLMKILSGGTQPDKGEIIIDGELAEIMSPVDAINKKIAMVQQELSLISSLSVAANIVLGREFKKGPLRVMDTDRIEEFAAEALETVELTLPLKSRVRELSVANQQMIEIARNIARKPRLLILDEPTTALTIVETDHLLNRLISLRDAGMSIIFISHKLEEVMQICDRVVVLRDGRKVGEVAKAEVTRDKLIKMMVGDKEFFERKASEQGHVLESEVILEARGLSRKGQFSDISFNLRRGEILGFFGLKGAGRSELFLSIFGAVSLDEGELQIAGEPVHFHDPQQAIKSGVGMVSEDRKTAGIFPEMDIKENIVISDLSAVASRIGYVRVGRIRQITKNLIAKLNIKTPSSEQKIKRLSGGNQQKAMISRWLHTDSNVLVFDEPTKGVDIGAKQDIYRHIKESAAEGNGVVVISSELEEILLLSDRVAVMRAGQIQATLEGDDLNAKHIMHFAAG